MSGCKAVETPPAEYLDALDDVATGFEVVVTEGVTSWQVAEALKVSDLFAGDLTEVPAEDGQDLKFTVEVDVRPEVELPEDFSGITVEVDEAKAAPEDVEARLIAAGSDGRNAIARSAAGDDYLLPAGAKGVPEGATLRIEVLREPIPGDEPWNTLVSQYPMLRRGPSTLGAFPFRAGVIHQVDLTLRASLDTLRPHLASLELGHAQWREGVAKLKGEKRQIVAYCS